MTDRTNVDKGYETLLGLWNKTKTNNNTNDCLPNVSYGFWHAGNTLDNFMDYLGRARPAGFQNTAATLGSQGVEIFKEVIAVDPTTAPLDLKPPTTAWWDDYGWWGIAFLKVHFLTGDGKYLHAAQVCWDFMEKGGRQYTGGTGTQGGTWNHDPNDGGIQNVITNALYLTLSARLYHITRGVQYLNGALAQYKWFIYQLDNGGYLNVSTNPPAWLIRQLPVGSEQYLWTGDQGALLGGLSSLRDSVISSNPDLAANLKKMCDAIVAGVKLSIQMVASPPWAPGGKVLHEANHSSGDWRFDLNGSVGKGVLIRYLGAYLLKRDGFIEQNADAVVRGSPHEYFANSWVADSSEVMNDDGCTYLGYLTRQCSGQDAMNAWLLPTS
jgi:hypothetical protein